MENQIIYKTEPLTIPNTVMSGVYTDPNAPIISFFEDYSDDESDDKEDTFIW